VAVGAIRPCQFNNATFAGGWNMSTSVLSRARLLVAGIIITLTIPALSVAKTITPDFVELAKKLKPTVVNIRTAKNIKPRQQMQRRNPQTPFDDFFGQFFDQMPQQRQRREQSLGTGFIISPDGYILTNNHVVSGADEVMVKLSDSREIKGEIKGQDEKLDLALIKINEKEKLHSAELGDSDTLEVGEWVIAIGNPFGLSQTVTAGIISAKGRVIGSGPYDDFIQTDASINPGNSGGPLFNAEGKVIGINSAIIAGGQGIGFAIPVNMAKGIISQLRENGKVVRGYLGVHIQAVTPELAKSFNLDAEKGALIAEVIKESPAEKAGIKQGDIVLEFDGKQINEYNELPRLVAVTPVDKKARIAVFRDGKKLELALVVGKLKDGENEVVASGGTGESAKLGITVQQMTPEQADRLGNKQHKGLVITDVRAGSPADDAGIARGDVIVEINGQHPESVEKYNAVVAGIKKGAAVRLLVRRQDGGMIYVAMKAE
jgi:serine protease Do